MLKLKFKEKRISRSATDLNLLQVCVLYVLFCQSIPKDLAGQATNSVVRGKDIECKDGVCDRQGNRSVIEMSPPLKKRSINNTIKYKFQTNSFAEFISFQRFSQGSFCKFRSK